MYRLYFIFDRQIDDDLLTSKVWQKSGEFLFFCSSSFIILACEVVQNIPRQTEKDEFSVPISRSITPSFGSMILSNSATRG